MDDDDDDASAPETTITGPEPCRDVDEDDEAGCITGDEVKDDTDDVDEEIADAD